LADINTQPASEMGDVEFFPGSLPDGRALFSATTIDEGNEVWVTDGTIAGTHMVAGFFPGPEGVEPENAVLADGVYYFHSLSRADTLWQTDGDTLAPVAGYDGSLVPAWDGNQLIGLAGPDSRELDSVFFLDGGQLTQFPIAPGQVFESRFPTARASGGIIFYASAGGLGDRALFASNGTSVGTNPLIDPSVIVTPDFVVFGNKVAVITAVSDGYLGIFDATTGAPSSANDSDPPEDASAVIALGDDGVFYSGVTDIGRELCFYDAEQDAHSCFDLNPTGSGLASSADLFLFEDGVCFAGTDGQTGTEPWCYSLSGGFTPLGDLSPGPNSSRPESFVAAEDVLYFTASAEVPPQVSSNGSRSVAWGQCLTWIWSPPRLRMWQGRCALWMARCCFRDRPHLNGIGMPVRATTGRSSYSYRLEPGSFWACPPQVGHSTS